MSEPTLSELLDTVNRDRLKLVRTDMLQLTAALAEQDTLPALRERLLTWATTIDDVLKNGSET